MTYYVVLTARADTKTEKRLTDHGKTRLVLFFYPFEEPAKTATMVVRRGAPPPPPADDSSSSDEEDAFLAFGGKKKAKKKTAKAKQDDNKQSQNTTKDKQDDNKQSQNGGDGSSAGTADADGTNAEDTSSNRRHHHVSSARQAKMDAMLKELQEAEQQQQQSSDATAGHYGPAASGHRSGRLPPPDKKGSYCEPGSEHLTTNIFVGNLDPCTTEEELTEAFRQFGDLYSVKIMWPRSAEERARGRNTGFVCFMDRSDAQEALDALSESDPFGTGRLLRLGWGKNVKMSVKRGTGGVPIPPIRGKDRKQEGKGPAAGVASGEPPGALYKRQRIDDAATIEVAESAPASALNTAPILPAKESNAPKYDAAIHAAGAIRVIPPTDPYRRKFIATVASFIAKDGSLLERKIAERESNNPKFSFLTNTCSVLQTEEEYQQELIFYRWRVYAFAQGDGFDHWQTQPFVMVLPNGRFWFPPALDAAAAAKEVAEAKFREADIRSKQEERKKLNEQRQFMTGRQLEHAKFGGISSASEGAAKLNDWEMEKFDELFRKKLCQSRDSICNCMAFCFEKSGASKQISDILKEALLEDGPEMSPETRIARLFLLSDVLFNSQQPGVRNAYRYRDAIEEMAPDIFESLGKHGKGSAGRMTMNKLNNAVSSVLNAWADWSVYNPVFLDELQARFDGKEMPSTKGGSAADVPETDVPETDVGISDAAQPRDFAEKSEASTIKASPKGDWSEAQDVGAGDTVPVDGEAMGEDVDGEALEDNDLDGEALSDDDLDGEALGDDDL